MYAVAQLRTVKLLNLHGFCHVFTIVIRLYCAERVVYGILLHMMLGKSAVLSSGICGLSVELLDSAVPS